MINFIVASFVYIACDPFFWPAMAFTTIIGIFIGSVIYNGNIAQVKKGLFSLAAYAALVLMTNVARIYPQLDRVTTNHEYMPFAGCMTLVFITIFYLLGMELGVIITQFAHKGGVRKND